MDTKKINDITAENKSLNLLKAVSCLIVVLLHCPLPGLLGEAVIYGLRFSVPSFFMVTGYYSYGKPSEWLREKMKKTLILTIGTESFSGAVCLLIAAGSGQNGISSWIHENHAFQNPVNTLLFGSFFNGTLWYLYALFWTLAILYFFEIYIGNASILYRTIPLLLMLHIIGWILVRAYGDIHTYVYFFRSALFYGIPFVMAGRYAAEYESKIARYLDTQKCLLLLITGVGMMILEFLISHTYMDLHASSIIITFALFWLACRHPHQDYIPHLRIIGKKYSMWIYIFHFPCILIADYLQATFVENSIPTFYAWVKPVIVIILSIALGAVAEIVSRKTCSAHRQQQDRG